MSVSRSYAPLVKFARELALKKTDDHYRRWHTGFDERGEKHNDVGGGYTWSKCYCIEGCAREALDAVLKGK